VAVAGYGRYTVKIPAQNMLVKKGSRDVSGIVAVFPRSTRLPVWDGRLANADVLPYWRWEFIVLRDVEKFRYSVNLSVMGSPEEGLKYRDKAQAHWHRPELEEWSGRMLHRFEVDTWDIWTAYHTPPTEAEEENFDQMLLSWFQGSKFANQGIHIEPPVVVNLPGLSLE
jgi:hypothetical protein